MSRMMLCLCAYTFTSIAHADEQLLPTPDPIGSTSLASTFTPCQTEHATYLTALDTYATAADDYADSLADRNAAQDALDQCLFYGGTCAQEQAHLDLANLAVDITSASLTNASESLSDASQAYYDCMDANGGGGGNGPGDPPEPDPFPPAYAIMSDKGLSGVVALLVSP